MQDMLQIEQMTVSEYNLRMQAFSLKQVDTTLNIRAIAWANRAAVSMNDNGEYTYKEFKDFFDYDKAINEALNPVAKEADMDPELVAIAKRLQEFRKGKGVEHG